MKSVLYNLQDKRGVLYFLGFVLFFTVVATRVESKWEEHELLLAYLIDSGVINQEMGVLNARSSRIYEVWGRVDVLSLTPDIYHASGKIYDDDGFEFHLISPSYEGCDRKAELLRVNCMLELVQVQNTLRNLELHFMEVKSSVSNELLNVRSSDSSAKMPDTINVLLPQVNQILVDCVREKNIVRRDPWYTRYFWFLFNPRLSSTRRALAETPLEAPAPSPTVLPPSPAPLIPLAPPEIPASPPLLPFFPRDSNDSNLQNADGKHTSTGVSDVNSGDRKTNKRTVVIAVVVTASVTFVMAALLFIFCRICCGPGSGRGRNDERPLLSLNLSDYSLSSSHKSFGLEASLNEQKLGSTNNQSFNNKANHAKTSGKFFVESHSLSHSKIEVLIETTTTSSAENSLQTSHGTPGPPGLPPLKPPPGRTEPPKPPVPPPPPPIIKFSSSGPPPPPCGHPDPPRGGPPPPIPNGAMAGPRPPPPPPGAPRPPPIGLKPPRPINSGPRTSASTEDEAGTSNKAKLKPFFWDKVLANPDHSMVWHQIKSGSFQFNEEMIESLFGYAPDAPAGKNKNKAKKESSSQDVSPQYIQIIDARKSQNLAILLKALNVTTEEVCDALEEGNELPTELIQTLLKMAPTAEEELKLRLYSGELSQLGPAERFLKVLVDIPFAFKRLESLIFMCTLQEETSTLKESFAVLEAACTELRKSRLFLKLLEAVLKTGNRMNDGTFRGGAQAFKLDTLLKLSDVKGTDGKTTLLHFVVQEIIRSEGIRTARAAKETNLTSSFKSDDPLEDSNQDPDEHLRSLGLEVVSGLVNELKNVKKAAAIEADNLTGTVSKLGHALVKARDFLNSDMKNVPEENGFCQTLRSFVQNAEVDIRWSREEEKRIMALVKNTADYFHGNSGKDEGLRLFIIVRDFLLILDKVCREVKNVPRKIRTSRKEDTVAAPPDPRQASPPDPRQRLFPAITDRRMDSSSSDDES